MDIIIRKAELRDYGGLCAIYADLDAMHRKNQPEIFITPDISGRTPEYISERIERDDCLLLVAETERGIVGLLEGCIAESTDFPANRKRRWVQIDSLAVATGAQNRNIGSLLLEKSKEWAKAHDIDRIELKVYAFNAGAIRFYNKAGFNELSKTMALDL